MASNKKPVPTATKKSAPAPEPPKRVRTRTEPKPKEPTTIINVIEFSEDSKNLIKDLIKALTNQPAPVVNITTTPSAAAAPVAKAETPKPVQTPKPAPVETPKAAEEKTEEGNTVSLTQIRELINLKAGEGKTAKIVSLLGEHGAKNASSLAEENYTNFYNQLKNL